MHRKTLRRHAKRLASAEEHIKKIKEKISPSDPRPCLKIGPHEISLKRAIIQPQYTSKTVLTDSTWRYVEIYLKSNRADEALFYWEQAQNFYKATQNLSLISAPLTSYYTFLNATKSLLRFKKVNFDTKHGVSGHREEGRYHLQNEHVILKPKGIVSALSNYLKEPIPPDGAEYNLKTILYNLQFIHRAYMLTFSGTELFVPIINPRFVCDKTRKEGWFEAQLEPSASTNATLAKLIGFGLDNNYDNESKYSIRRNKTFHWDAPRNKPTSKSLDALNRYHVKIRSQLRYICSSNDLWYIKRKDLKNDVINRGTLPLIFMAMHRLSELSRYQPQILKNHLDRNASWLLSEFITKSMIQFIDQISSEITGYDFRPTGFRT